MKSKLKLVFPNKYLFYVLVTVVTIKLAASAFDLQIVNGANYNYMATANAVRYQTVYAPRGVVFDRNGKQLIYNVSTFSVSVEADKIADDENGAIDYVAETVGVSREELWKVYQDKRERGANEIVLIDGLLWESGPFQLTADSDKWPGIRVDESVSRQYPEGYMYSHIIGYTGAVSKSDVTNGKDANDTIGKSGVEYTYDELLRGTNGLKVSEEDRRGLVVDSYIATEPITGENLYLTIDDAVQQKATELLAKAIDDMDGTGGAVLIQDVHTGELVAMVTLPSYDSNIFVDGSRSAELSTLFNDPAMPLFNRSISAAYPPGSVFKTVTATMGLQEGVITPTTEIYTGGTFEYKGVTFQDASKRNWGDINVTEALKVSSSIFFMKTSLKLQDEKGNAIDTLVQYANYFGLGMKSGIDLPGEATGAVASPDTKARLHNEVWYPGDLLNASMGQGDHLVTPIQLVTLATAIANGGYVMKPYIVGAIDSENGVMNVSPEVVRSGFVSDETLSTVRKGMRLAVTDGIAKTMNSSVVNIAVKTGTAESGLQSKNPHAFIMGFAPYEAPEVSFVFFVEAGGWSYEAAPYARALMDWYFGTYKPSLVIQAQSKQVDQIGQTALPQSSVVIPADLLDIVAFYAPSNDVFPLGYINKRIWRMR